jgi:hypothetical protein
MKLCKSMINVQVKTKRARQRRCCTKDEPLTLYYEI